MKKTIEVTDRFLTNLGMAENDRIIKALYKAGHHSPAEIANVMEKPESVIRLRMKKLDLAW